MLKAVLMCAVASVGCLVASGVEQLSVADEVPMLFMIADYGDVQLYLKERAGGVSIDNQIKEPLNSQQDVSLRDLSEHVDKLVSENRIGGVLFKGMWTPAGLAARIKHLQSMAMGPLIFAQDLEWGLSMRHFGSVEMPKALCMGAISDDSLLAAWADMLAKTAKEIGITCFLGPVADVYSNPKNPVIHDRSFGDDPVAVAHRVSVVVRALRRHGLLVCPKHFPGHGCTSQDSHFCLPVVNKTLDQLQKVEFVPFRAAIEAGADCVMTVNVCFPNTPAGSTPASLSSFWCQDILRKEFGFEGVEVTDDLIMSGALGTKTYAQTAVQAIKAGNDLCIISLDVEDCLNSVAQAVHSGELKKSDLDAHARRVQKLQSTIPPTMSVTSLGAQIQLHNLLYKSALTLVGAPFQFDRTTTVVLQVGDVTLCPFIQDLVQAYPASQVESWRRQPRPEEVEGVLASMKTKTELLVVLCDVERAPSRSFGITEELVKDLQRVVDSGMKVRYVIFGSPYVLMVLPKPVISALVAYERTPGSERAAFEAVSGAFEPKGVLPVRL